MPLESVLLAYAGLANFALANPRHRPTRALPAAPPRRAAKIIGTALLLVSAWLAFLRFGPLEAPVAWIGQLSLAGLLLVLAMSRWPRPALGAWLPFMVLAMPICFS